MQIYTVEAVLLVFLILITICIIYERDLLSAIMTYGAFSFCAVLKSSSARSRRSFM